MKAFVGYNFTNDYKKQLLEEVKSKLEKEDILVFGNTIKDFSVGQLSSANLTIGKKSD